LATLAGISISPGGTEDAKLYIRGLPDITVGPWQMQDTLDSDEEVEYMVAEELILVQVCSISISARNVSVQTRGINF